MIIIQWAILWYAKVCTLPSFGNSVKYLNLRRKFASTATTSRPYVDFAWDLLYSRKQFSMLLVWTHLKRKACKYSSVAPFVALRSLNSETEWLCDLCWISGPAVENWSINRKLQSLGFKSALNRRSVLCSHLWRERGDVIRVDAPLFFHNAFSDFREFAPEIQRLRFDRRMRHQARKIFPFHRRSSRVK